MKKITIILALVCLVPLVCADVQLPLTVIWNPVFATYYSGTLCLEETNLFGAFDNIGVGYTYDDHSGSPPSPKIMILIDKGNNKYCNDLQPTLWDSSVPDTLTDAWIKVEYGAGITFKDDKWSTNVSVALNDSHHLFRDCRTTFNISLNQGWNLISTPLIPLNNSVDSVFESINYSDLFSYDSKWRVPTEINNIFGYWINVDNEDILTVSGCKPESPLISIKEGWNLIGYPSLNESLINETLKNVDYSVVYGYNNSEWYPYNPNKLWNNLNRFTPGFGYWVHMIKK